MTRNEDKGYDKSNIIFVIFLLVFIVLVAIKEGMLKDIPRLFQSVAVHIAPQSEFPEGYKIAVWEWRDPDKFSTNKIVEYLDSLQSESINTLYLNIERYINIVEDRSLGEREMDLFSQSVGTFLLEAEQRGMEVHAFAGAPDWARTSHEYLPLALLDYVMDYNAGHEIGFSGIQFDIEFYNAEDYRKRRVRDMQDYLKLVDRIKDRLQQLSIEERISFGLVIPYWFDRENSMSTEINWNGEKKLLGYHLIDSLNEYEDSYIVIMAYRNKVLGSNGTIELVQDEINYIRSNSMQIEVMVAQETTDVEPYSITYYGRGKNAVKSSAATIAGVLGGKSGIFKGITIHTAESFLKMR